MPREMLAYTIENTLVHERLNSPGPKRVLVLSGGGVRGLITLGMLKKVEDELKEREQQLGRDPGAFRLCHYFDLIGGTSTGAILSTLLALGKSVDEITTIYEDMIPKIFSAWRVHIPFLHAQFSEENLERAINEIFDEVLVKEHLSGVIEGWTGVKSPTLGSKVLRTGIVLVAKRIDTNSIWALSNNPLSKYWHVDEEKWNHIYKEDGDTGFFPNCNYPLRAWVKASASAPYYLDAVQIDIDPGQPGLFLDGGASPLNNPAKEVFFMTALKAAATRGGNRQGLSPYGFGWQTGKDNIFMLSLGTGSWREQHIVKDYQGYSAAKKAYHALMGIIADGEAQTVTWMQAISEPPSKELAPSHYINWNLKDMDGLSIFNEGTEPLLTFRHVNPTLDQGWLQKNLGLEYKEKQVLKIRELVSTDKKNMECLKVIGGLMGQKNISQADFPAKFDI